MSTFSLREKTIFGALIATLVVSIAYFTRVTPLLLSGASLSAFLWPAIAAVVATVIVQVAYQVLLAAGAAYGRAFSGGAHPHDVVAQPLDERDRLVDLGAARWAYWTLSAGCVLVLGAVVHCAIFDRAIPAALLAHLLALVLTLADVVKYSAQLIGYRALA